MAAVAELIQGQLGTCLARASLLGAGISARGAPSGARLIGPNGLLLARLHAVAQSAQAECLVSHFVTS